MAKATGARSEIAYVVESTYGTTPGTPSLIAVPRTGGAPNMQKETFESADIRSDRMVADMRHGFKSASLSMAIELRDGDYDAFFESLMYNTWSTNVLKVGTTEKSFSIEAAYEDITQYALMTGGIVNGFSCNITPDGIVSGSFDFVGKSLSYSGSSADADGYTAASGAEPFDSLSGSINEGGSSIAIVTGLDFSVTNNIEPAKVVGADTASEQIEGVCQVTGTITAYFQDATLVNKFINETSSSIDVTLSDPAANTLKFDFPNVLYTGGDLDVGGTGPITLSLPFTALYDATDESSLVITRSA
jgi:hypothetical protein